MVLKAKTTTGRYINYITSLTLDIPNNVKYELGVYCAIKAHALSIEITENTDNKKSFEYMALETERQSYQKLSYFWLNGSSYNTDRTQKIVLKNGTLNCPLDWHILDDELETAKNSSHALVIECRNFQIFNGGIPHFLVFSDKVASELNDFELERIYAACARDWPEFMEVLKLQVPPPDNPSDPDYNDKVKAHLACPFIKIFTIISDDSPHYNEFNNYPYNCVIKRT